MICLSKHFYQQKDKIVNNHSLSTSQSKQQQTFIPSSSKQQQSNNQQEINSRIKLLEIELEQSKRKAEEMNSLLENTRQHYSQLEGRYNQARDIVKSFQEREREMLKREETHIELMRTKEKEYSELILNLRSRIEELEKRIELAIAERKEDNNEKEREKQQQFIPQQQENEPPPAPPAHRGNHHTNQTQQQRRNELMLPKSRQQQREGELQQQHQHQRQFRPVGLRHAGLVSCLRLKNQNLKLFFTDFQFSPIISRSNYFWDNTSTTLPYSFWRTSSSFPWASFVTCY